LTCRSRSSRGSRRSRRRPAGLGLVHLWAEGCGHRMAPGEGWRSRSGGSPTRESEEPRVGCDVIAAAVSRIWPFSWKATKKPCDRFRPTARGAPGGHWPPRDLRDGQELPAIGASGADQGGDADVVGHVPTPPQLAICTGTQRVRRQDRVARDDSTRPESPGRVETCSVSAGATRATPTATTATRRLGRCCRAG
jgi:hypothetical protein